LSHGSVLAELWGPFWSSYTEHFLAGLLDGVNNHLSRPGIRHSCAILPILRRKNR